MSFVRAVNGTPSIRPHLKAGLQALARVDRGRVSCDGRNLRGSVNIDEAVRPYHPNAARWDYVVGFGREHLGDAVVWLEVHPASSHHVGDVLAKLHWLKQRIRDEAPELGRFPRHFCWIATGAIAFGRNSPYARKIAQAGLRFPDKHVDIKWLFAQR